MAEQEVDLGVKKGVDITVARGSARRQTRHYMERDLQMKEAVKNASEFLGHFSCYIDKTCL